VRALRSALVVMMFASTAFAQASSSERFSQVELTLAGVSCHYQARENEYGEKYNEFNPGLGLRISRLANQRNYVYGEAGFYRDSYSFNTYYGGIGYQRRYGVFGIGAFGGLRVRDYGDEDDDFAYGNPLFIVPVASVTYHRTSLALIWLLGGHFSDDNDSSLAVSLTISLLDL
jgi:hypothetical protein